MTYLKCGRCGGEFELAQVATASADDGWMAIRCERCGGQRAANAAAARKRYRQRRLLTIADRDLCREFDEDTRIWERERGERSVEEMIADEMAGY